MKRIYLVIFILIIGLFSFNSTGNNVGERAKIIQAYFHGWENKNWNSIAGLLAPDFTFTSPNNDDHLPTDKFKAKCWIQADHIKKFDFIRFMENGDDAFVIYQCTTTTNSVFRNTEYFTFSNGKVKSIEVFFGGSGQGFPTNEKK